MTIAIETPDHQVVDVLGDNIEVREYSPFRLATTIVEGPSTAAGNTAFRRLAGYIFGANSDDTKIAMTAPVIQSAAGEERFEVAFFMPRTIDKLPSPLDDRVEMRERTMTVAVLRYRGSWSDKRYQDHLVMLRGALASQNRWVTDGEPIWARYDSPFKPWFLRTNEVMIPVLRARE